MCPHTAVSLALICSKSTVSFPPSRVLVFSNGGIWIEPTVGVNVLHATPTKHSHFLTLLTREHHASKCNCQLKNCTDKKKKITKKHKERSHTGLKRHIAKKEGKL